jgi:uncharacterized protein
MGILTEEMQRVVEEQRLGFIATVCSDGTPNLSPKGTTRVWDEDHLIFADICSPGTIENLRQNPALEINVVDVVLRKGYRFKGKGEVLTDGPLYDKVLAFYRKLGLSFPVRSIVMVHVERALPLISPAYDSGLSEDEVRSKWQRYWDSIRAKGGEQQNAEIQIRLATPGDAAAISSILRKSFIEYEARYTSEGFAATVLMPDEVQTRMNEGPVWVALESGVVLGTLSAVSTPRGLYIRGMAVDPAARGKGVGAKLLERSEELAIASGSQRLFLSTTPFLMRAIRLYERYGFHRKNEGPADLFGTPLFTMVKDLNGTQAASD